MRYLRDKPSISVSAPIILMSVLVCLHLSGTALAAPRTASVEKKIWAHIVSEDFDTFQADQRCHGEDRYRVYLIDNFEQRVDLVPEVLTSHGEMLMRLLVTSRDDVAVSVLNTSLDKGLSRVIHDLVEGACADAVVSAIPGSNYTYGQIGSFFAPRVEITSKNILERRRELRKLLRGIATRGFPSVAWLQNVDVNSVKLRHDARKFLLIEALGRFNVPVILPYGNRDARYRGQVRSVNLLSLASNARAYSALDQKGRRVPGFPYSPLSSGDETAVYDIVECPHPDDPFKAVLDINADGQTDYAFFRTGKIAYRNAEGELAFAPPVTRQHIFVKWLLRARTELGCQIESEIVLTADQYQKLQRQCPATFDGEISQPYIWLNAQKAGRVFEFRPACWSRGIISGTSVIPPNKLNELLPPKPGTETREGREDPDTPMGKITPRHGDIVDLRPEARLYRR